jgi:hypothetical protein
LEACPTSEKEPRTKEAVPSKLKTVSGRNAVIGVSGRSPEGLPGE